MFVGGIGFDMAYIKYWMGMNDEIIVKNISEYFTNELKELENSNNNSNSDLTNNEFNSNFYNNNSNYDISPISLYDSNEEKNQDFDFNKSINSVSYNISPRKNSHHDCSTSKIFELTYIGENSYNSDISSITSTITNISDSET